MARKLQPCGTQGGYSRHRWRGEEPCDPCRLAWRDYQRAWREATGRRSYEKPQAPHDLAPCGTYAAAQRHKVHGEPVCDDCAAAVRTYKTEYARNARVAKRERQAALDAMFAEVVAEVTGATQPESGTL